MKDESLQHLLAKYQEGNLSADELEQLNKLCLKDETLAAANHRANGIIFRRTARTVLVALAGVAVLGVGINLLIPHKESQMIAEVKEVPTIVEEQPVVVEEKPVQQPVASSPKPKQARTAVKESTVETISSPSDDEPVVICNNQCDADSVINDIWKFLTA